MSHAMDMEDWEELMDGPCDVEVNICFWETLLITYKLNDTKGRDVWEEYHLRDRNQWYIPILKYQWSMGRADHTWYMGMAADGSEKNCVLFPGAFRWIYEGFEIAKLVGVVLDLDPQFQTNQHISFKMCVFW